MPNFPTGTVLNANIIANVGLLAKDVNGGFIRTPQTYIITNSAIAAAGATSLQLTADRPLLLQEGSKLTFGAVNVTTAADVNLTTTASPVPLSAPLGVGGIAASATASTNGFLRILGGENLSLNVQDKEVSTRSFENDLWDDARKVMIGGTMPWSGLYRLGDKAIDNIIEPIAFSADELWVEFLYPDGKFRKGASFVKGFKEDLKLDDIRRLSWEFRLIGTIQYGKVAL